MPFRIPRVYPLTDVVISGLSHAEQVKRLAAGGATIIQLREKTMAGCDFYNEAQAAVEIARKAGIRLIINDRVDIALAVGADGVHLGHDGGIDESGDIEQPIVVPIWIRLSQAVADGIVLSHEQGVEH